MKKLSIKTLILLAATSAIAACSPEAIGKFYTPAGNELDTGTFGNSTMNNRLIQTGQLSYAVALATRFSEEVPSLVNFEFNEATLDAEAKRVLDAQISWINQFPEIQFRVYGHTDLVGSEAYNQQLGLRRAQAVVEYMIENGISSNRLEAVSSYGESEPLIPTQNRERRNRRAETQVSGFVQDSQMVLDGKYAEIIYREYVNSAVPGSGVAAQTE